MTKKEAQKVFSEMVKDARKLIDGDNIRTVQISMHQVTADVPEGFSQPSPNDPQRNWFSKSYLKPEYYGGTTKPEVCYWIKDA